MECMCAQTRPQFMLSSKEFLGNGVRNHVNSKGKKTLYWRLRGYYQFIEIAKRELSGRIIEMSGLSDCRKWGDTTSSMAKRELSG